MTIIPNQHAVVTPNTALFCDQIAQRIANRGGVTVFSIEITGSQAAELTIDPIARQVRSGVEPDAGIHLTITSADLDAVLAGKADAMVRDRVTLVVSGNLEAVRGLAPEPRQVTPSKDSRDLDPPDGGPQLEGDAMMDGERIVKGRPTGAPVDTSPRASAAPLAQPKEARWDVVDLALQNLLGWLDRVVAGMPSGHREVTLAAGELHWD